MQDHEKQALDNLTDALAALGVETVTDPTRAPWEVIYELAGAVTQSVADILAQTVSVEVKRSDAEQAFAAGWRDLAREAGDGDAEQYSALAILVSCIAVIAGDASGAKATGRAARHAIVAGAALSALAAGDLPADVRTKITKDADQAIADLRRTWRPGPKGHGRGR